MTMGDLGFFFFYDWKIPKIPYIEIGGIAGGSNIPSK